jgi:hypothetical protein
LFDWWCLTPLSTIFQLYRGGPFLLVEESGGPGEDHQPLTEKLYHILLYTSPWSRFELTTSVVTGTDCIGCCKSNNHTITTTVRLTVFFSLSTNNYQTLEKRLRCEMSTPYAGDVRILLLIKGKLTIGKVKSSRLSRCFQSSSVLDLNTKVKVRSRSLSVSSILWFKVIWIDVLQIIAESVTEHHLYNRSWN